MKNRISEPEQFKKITDNANVNVYVNNQYNQNRRNKYLRNSMNSNESIGSNNNDRHNQMMFSTFNNSPDKRNDEIRQSLDVFKHIESQNSRIYANLQQPEIFSSNNTEIELEQALNRSINSDKNFEVFNIEQSYTVDENVKREINLQSSRPFAHHNEIFPYFNVDKYCSPVLNSQQNVASSDLYNRRDSMGQPITNYANNIVSLTSGEDRFQYPSKRMNPHSKGILAILKSEQLLIQ